jgi:hypothetical protein
MSPSVCYGAFGVFVVPWTSARGVFVVGGLALSPRRSGVSSTGTCCIYSRGRTCAVAEVVAF